MPNICTWVQAGYWFYWEDGTVLCTPAPAVEQQYQLVSMAVKV